MRLELCDPIVMAEQTWTIQAVGSISTATMMEQCGEILSTMMVLKSSDMEYRDSLEKNLHHVREELEAADEVEEVYVAHVRNA